MFREKSQAVEHIRLSSRESIKGLPNLNWRVPSRIQDAAILAVSAGVPYVDVILARSSGALPWDLDNPEINDLLAPFLSEAQQAVVIYPDLGGPVPVGPGTEVPMGERVERFVRSVKAVGSEWANRYQVALVDCLDVEGSQLWEMMEQIVGFDLGVVRWSGRPDRLATHGWRSGAAFMAGLLASDDIEMGRGLAGRTHGLPVGRMQTQSRIADLSFGPEERPEEDESLANTLMELRIHPEVDRVYVASEPSFRQPLGEWTIPALRTVKAVHRYLVKAAQGFVFRKADEAEAAGLSDALMKAMRPFIARGILVGAGGDGTPEVEGLVERIPGEPGLSANVIAQLRPWSQNVTVRVVVRPGGQPSLEVL